MLTILLHHITLLSILYCPIAIIQSECRISHWLFVNILWCKWLHCQTYELYTIVLYSHIVVYILLLNLLKCISKPCIIKGCTAGVHTCTLIIIKQSITFDTVSFEKLYDLTVFLATFWDEIVRRSAPKRWRVNVRRSAPKRWRVNQCSGSLSVVRRVISQCCIHCICWSTDESYSSSGIREYNYSFNWCYK